MRCNVGESRDPQMNSIVSPVPPLEPNQWSGRAFLWCAWSLPAIPAFLNLHTMSDALSALVVTAGLAGVVAFLPGSLWKWGCAVTTLLVPFTFWWCGAATVTGSGPGYEAAVAAIQTHTNEAWGAVSFLSQFPLFFVSCGLHAAFLGLTWRSLLRARTNNATPQGQGAKVALLASLMPLTVTSLTSMQTGEAPGSLLFGQASLASPLGSLEAIIAHKIRLLAWYREQGYRREPAPAAMHVTQPMLAMFVIGESTRADALGPQVAQRGSASRQLSERISDGLGAWLPTTCASSDGTHLSVPLLLTATPPSARDAAPALPTILGILHADGFSTAWLANNEAGPDAREKGHDRYAGPFRINPDRFLTDPVEHWKLDDDALPAAQSFALPVDRPKALILHFIGTHFPYNERYPAGEFERETDGLSKNQGTLLRYERAAEHQALTLVKLASILDSVSAPAFLVYTSDHGEDLPGDPSGQMLHLGPRTTREVGTVPSIVLWNRAMAETGRPAASLSRLMHATELAHADIARLFLSLATVAPGEIEPTPNPAIWARVHIGDAYAAVRCSSLEP